MGKLVKVLMLLFGCYCAAQPYFSTSSGKVEFNASTPLETIFATNKDVKAILDVHKAEIAAVVQVKAFEFKRKLMQEHFNESYMESHTFPKAVFSGKIISFSTEGLKSTPKEYVIQGNLSVHGVTKAIETKATIFSKGESIEVLSTFYIKPEDYGIKVPKIMFNKIAENVKVTLAFQLKK